MAKRTRLQFKLSMDQKVATCLSKFGVFELVFKKQKNGGLLVTAYFIEKKVPK